MCGEINIPSEYWDSIVDLGQFFIRHVEAKEIENDPLLFDLTNRVSRLIFITRDRSQKEIILSKDESTTFSQMMQLLNYERELCDFCNNDVWETLISLVK